MIRRRTLLAIALMAIIARWVASADGQEVPWIEVPPVKQVDAGPLGPVLADIESRLPAGHPYRNPQNLVNWAHEGTHGVNSRIRNAAGRPNVNALYCLEGRAVVLREPNLRISQHIAPLVPRELRGQILGSGWDDRPLYVLDEWVAYTNGTAAGLDCARRGLRFSQPGEGDWFTVSQMLRGCAYATALVMAIDRVDPDYPDRDALVAFVGWNLARCLALAEQSNQVRPFYDVRNTEVLRALAARFIAEEES